MKKLSLPILSIILVNILGGWAMTTDEIMKQVAQAQRGVKTEYVEIESVLEEEKAGLWVPKKQWQLIAIAKYGSEDLIRIDVLSGTEKGTKFLMRGEQQWQYLSTLDRTLKISGNARFARFVGSDFVFEDLELENDAKYSYQLAGELENSWRIIAKPLKKSSYTYRILRIAKENFAIMKIQFFKNDGIEKILNQKIKAIQTGLFRPSEAVMLDQKNKTRTVLIFKNRVVNIKLPDKVFNSQNLSEDLNLNF